MSEFSIANMEMKDLVREVVGNIHSAFCIWCKILSHWKKFWHFSKDALSKFTPKKVEEVISLLFWKDKGILSCRQQHVSFNGHSTCSFNIDYKLIAQFEQLWKKINNTTNNANNTTAAAVMARGKLITRVSKSIKTTTFTSTMDVISIFIFIIIILQNDKTFSRIENWQ